MEYFTIALAKGRLAEVSMEILEHCGIDCSELKEKSRKLVFYDKKNNIRFLLVKPTDVPTYVDHGVADIGIVGKDTLLEADRPLYEMLDLGYGKCTLSLAGYESINYNAIPTTLRVATKYPNVARKYFGAEGRNIEIIKLNGSVELGPIIGLSDIILDIVESGKTLKENGLAVLTDICDVSARLVVNQVSLKTKSTVIRELIDKIAIYMEEKNDKNI